jgi:hypothetical protein
VQAGNRADRLSAPTLRDTHDPQVEGIPALAHRLTRLRTALTQPAQHSKMMPPQLPVTPAHRSDVEVTRSPARPAAWPSRQIEVDVTDRLVADNVLERREDE